MINKVSSEIMEIIERSLEQIEESLDSRIILALDSGPRGGGAPCLDSPHRVQFVYVHRLDWYLQLIPGADLVELPVSDDFTLTGWDIGRLLKTMKNEDAEKTSWLRSAVTYRVDTDVLTRLRSFSVRSMRPASDYLRELDLAQKLLGGWKLGSTTTSAEFIDAMRAILAARWIADKRGVVPGDFSMLCDGLDEDLCSEIDVLIDANAAAPKGAPVPPSPRSQVFFLAELQRLRNVDIEESEQMELPPFDHFYAELIRRFG
ncbi:DNA polymerase beta superfamily protein [Acetobacter oeni]|uniref:DNA polymerase beta superfamily protein n=1 Tax=Acetobacter oeni TaxID=304077 RepID=UPI0015696C02|nr:nucleotidyltransferase domain-containing protein [Acetobacter oeni]MBB3881407.1 hypothetical protein [Acetobacter oeni]